MQCQSYTWEDRGASVAIRVPLPGAILPAAAGGHIQCDFSERGLQLCMREGLDGSDRPLVSTSKLNTFKSFRVSQLVAQIGYMRVDSSTRCENLACSNHLIEQHCEAVQTRHSLISASECWKRVRGNPDT